MNEKYNLCAKLIRESDFIMLSTGAGWSSDSNLPVYRDVASI